MKHNRGVGNFIGAAGGGGFAWLLQHVPTALAFVLAIGASIAVARMLWMLYRGIRQCEREHTEAMAELERAWQSWKTDIN